MDVHFGSGKNSSSRPDSATGSKSRTVLLAVLLLVAAAFGYLYFFTGVITPQEPAVATTAPGQQVVKKPLPTRVAEPPAVQPPAAQPPAAAPAAPLAAADQKPAAPAVGGAPAAVPPPVKKEQPSPAAPPEKAAPQKAASSGAPQGAAAKPAAAKPSPAVATGPAVKKATKSSTRTVKPAAVAAAGGTWKVATSNYLIADVLTSDFVKIRKAGFEPNIVSVGKVKAPMIRLLRAEFTSRAAAQDELEKLKKFVSDAFVMQHGKTFAVYVGSFQSEARAAAEMKRLAAAGVSLRMKRVAVSVPAKRIAVGAFKNKKNAEAAVAKLRSIGIKTTLSR